ncbi:MAG: hypothetical protein F4Y74_03935 [Gemmatimonadales bacterium]|nr:hypothetical protein [Gemmatimonadales bacterium]MYG19714.1 hypothetical protein [Gemmatimonadales bacterium]MYH09837.1 hypothetical protein [Gemmatimonadales bacterium]
MWRRRRSARLHRRGTRSGEGRTPGPRAAAHLRGRKAVRRGVGRPRSGRRGTPRPPRLPTRGLGAVEGCP